MALTQLKTGAIADDAVTEDKIANAINTARAANTAKDLTALSASNLTSGTVPDARFPATLPAASAANLTAVPAANITGTLPAISGANLTSLTATNLTGTIADARFPATLPAASAANLTSIPAANITGALPAISGASLTGISTDTDFAQWRVNTLFSGAADPITNWTESTNNCTFSESSGIFTFPSTGFWRIHMHLYGYYNADSDNAELHIMRTTNNSSYTHKTHSYTSLNNDDGGNLYTTLEGDLVFDVTDVSTHKIKFKIANTSINWAADANRNDTYAIFMKLGET
jgi:hypothetical protein